MVIALFALAPLFHPQRSFQLVSICGNWAKSEHWTKDNCILFRLGTTGSASILVTISLSKILFNTPIPLVSVIIEQLSLIGVDWILCWWCIVVKNNIVYIMHHCEVNVDSKVSYLELIKSYVDSWESIDRSEQSQCQLSLNHSCTALSYFCSFLSVV